VPRGPTRVRIGRPLANTRMYVLDDARQLVPIGSAGELYIGGAGVAVGYRNRSDLTAERFVANPFSSDRMDRLYRTGDTVRYDVDGQLEFIGRGDSQIKLRGVRVELGEIEITLRQHPAIADAAVALWEVRPDDRRLAGYVVLAPDRTATEPDVRAWLSAKLPETMIPAAIVFLDRLPQTPNGKLDRRALPVPESGDQGGGDPPSTDLEQQIAAIWADVLGSDHVGATDAFFALGGHSLLMVEVQDRLRDLLNQEISLVDLFRFPTVRAIAAHLSESETGRTDPASAANAAKQRGQSRRQVLARRAMTLGKNGTPPQE
jgi:acyl carrier protein